MSCCYAEGSELTASYSEGDRTAIEAVYRVGTHSAHGRTAETENKRSPLAFRAWFAKGVWIVDPCLNKYSQTNFSEAIDPKRRFGKEELRVEESVPDDARREEYAPNRPSIDVFPPDAVVLRARVRTKYSKDSPG